MDEGQDVLGAGQLRDPPMPEREQVLAHPGTFSVDADFSLNGAWNAMTGAKKTC
jgi:hypothetical protein